MVKIDRDAIERGDFISRREDLKDRPGPDNRYALTEQIVDGFVFPGRLRYTTAKFPIIDLEGSDTYVVKEADKGRLDLVAHRFYDNSRLWWAIALVNNIRNPLIDMDEDVEFTGGMFAGQSLSIPLLSNVEDAFAGTTERESGS